MITLEIICAVPMRLICSRIRMHHVDVLELEPAFSACTSHATGIRGLILCCALAFSPAKTSPPIIRTAASACRTRFASVEIGRHERSA